MKKLFLTLITFFLGFNLVFASTNTIPRTDADLGVNKKWNINEKNIANVKRTPRVDAKEKIYDFAEIITDEEESELLNKIEAYIAETNMDMVILTTDLAYNDYEIEDYAADFYDYNDFGLKYPLYSGIILVRNINSYNRFFNIYTFGNAQLYYDYDTCEAILDYIYDDLRSDSYLSGFTKFIESASSYFKKGPDDTKYVDEDGYIHIKYQIPWKASIIISAIVTSITMIILVKKNKMVKKATEASVYSDKEKLIFSRKVDQFLHSHTSSYTISSSSGGGGGGSHSGSSGGGHGGGGGRHG